MSVTSSEVPKHSIHHLDYLEAHMQSSIHPRPRRGVGL